MRIWPFYLIFLCFISCQNDDDAVFTDVVDDEKEARLMVISAYCHPSDLPLCQPEDFVTYAEGVEVYLFEDVEMLELGDYFADCQTDSNGRCLFPSLEPGTYLMFSRYEQITEAQWVKVTRFATTWEHLVYPDPL